MSNNKKSVLPSWVLRLIGITSLATAIISFAVYWLKKYPPRRKITSNERNIGVSNKPLKVRKHKKKMTISLKNTVLWNPSSDVSMYAFHERSLQLLERLSYLYEIYLIIHVSSEEERNHIQSLLENSQGNIFAKSGGCIDYRKIIYCSEEEGKMHIIRHIESSVHIEGGWEQDDGEEIVKKLKPFMNKIIWIVTKARKDSLKHEVNRGGLGHNIELAEKLLDTSVAREAMQD